VDAATGNGGLTSSYSSSTGPGDRDVFKVKSLGFRVWGLGFGVRELGFEDWRVRYRVYEIRVGGLGPRDAGYMGGPVPAPGAGDAAGGSTVAV
jgi:hypothetical protein